MSDPLLYISTNAVALRDRVMQMSPADDPSDLMNAVAELATLVSQLAVEVHLSAQTGDTKP